MQCYVDLSPGILRQTPHGAPPLLGLALHIIGAERKIPDRVVMMTSYNCALEITRWESIETTLLTKRLLQAGALIRVGGGQGRSAKWAVGGCQCESRSETSRVQCGKDRMGTRKSEPIAYRAISGRLT